MKYLKEELNHTFTRDTGSNKLSNLGIGKGVLINKWLEEMEIAKSCVINDDLTIDATSSVFLSNENIYSLPDYIQFNRVEDDFVISVNKLTTLRGCPKYVGERMLCHKNNLTNLDYAPLECNQFHCDENPIPPDILAKFIYTHDYRIYYTKTIEVEKELAKLRLMNEAFTRDSTNKLGTVGVGKMPLIKKWLEQSVIQKYTINDDLTIDVFGDVYLRNRYIGDKNNGEFPLYIKFGKIQGDFVCSENQLTSLRGCPDIVYGDFDCRKNKLTSLKGCPTFSGGDFDCRNNELKSLEYSPQKNIQSFHCEDNKLISLKGCPQIINGNFCCHNNELKSLEYCPKEVKDFDCENNELISFDYAPIKVEGVLWIYLGNHFTQNMINNYRISVGKK